MLQEKHALKVSDFVKVIWWVNPEWRRKNNSSNLSYSVNNVSPWPWIQPMDGVGVEKNEESSTGNAKNWPSGKIPT